MIILGFEFLELKLLLLIKLIAQHIYFTFVLKVELCQSLQNMSLVLLNCDSNIQLIFIIVLVNRYVSISIPSLPQISILMTTIHNPQIILTSPN